MGNFSQFPCWEMLTVDHGNGQFFMTALMHIWHGNSGPRRVSTRRACAASTKSSSVSSTLTADTEDALQKTPMEPPTYQQPGSASFKQQAHRERMQTSPASVDSTSNPVSLELPKARKTSHLASMSTDFDQHHPASMCMETNQHAQSMSMDMPQYPMSMSMDFDGRYLHPAG